MGVPAVSSDDEAAAVSAGAGHRVAMNEAEDPDAVEKFPYADLQELFARQLPEDAAGVIYVKDKERLILEEWSRIRRKRCQRWRQGRHWQRWQGTR